MVGTSLAGTLSGVVSVPPLGSRPFAQFDTISDTTWGFGDLAPMFQLKWNAGVNNFMTYVTGDIPVGAYQSTRLSNIGIGHGAIDAGGGYTYFNPQTGNEFSGVLGFTYNFTNTATQYQNGVDMHFDWGASQFLSKQVMVGLVGYVYKEIGCDSGSGDRVGCFQSQVIGIGPQIGFLFPVGDMQGYLNLKAYGEFDMRKSTGGLEYLDDLLDLAACARSTSDDKAHRQKILGPSCRSKVMPNGTGQRRKMHAVYCSGGAGLTPPNVRAIPGGDGDPDDAAFTAGAGHRAIRLICRAGSN